MLKGCYLSAKRSLTKKRDSDNNLGPSFILPKDIFMVSSARLIALYSSSSLIELLQRAVLALEHSTAR